MEDGEPLDEETLDRALGEAKFLDKMDRHRALSMLASGSCIGIVGFILAAIGGYWNVISSYDLRGKITGTYPSGKPFYPLTVSEMVSDPESTAGKAFLAFELCAAIMILGSWYPYLLENVYIGQKHKALRACNGCPSWATIRQFVPMCGLFLVALVSTTPVTRMRPSDFVTNQIHILAATALFGGYILCEVVCLWGFHIQGAGGCIRMIVIIGCAICAVTTIVLQFTYPYAPYDVLPCQDNYTQVTIGDLTAKLASDASGGETLLFQNAQKYIESVALSEGLTRSDPATVLQDTAHGVCLVIKVVTFWSEVIAGVLGLGSHLVIWYYAPERQYKIGDDNDLLLGPDDYKSSEDDS